MTTEMSIPAIIKRGHLSSVVSKNRFPEEHSKLYAELLNQALSEFPSVEGYETVHAMLVERAVFLFVSQKLADSKQNADVDFKAYHKELAGFIKTVESLLKEARTISAELTFKMRFVMQVMEIIDRIVSDMKQKKLIARELEKLAAA